MTVNVFEGARRIARITAVLWAVVVCSTAMIYFEPRITIRYLVEGLDYIPIPMKEDKTCVDYPAQGGRELTTKKGTDVFMMLCFKEHTGDNGNTGLIPVRYDETGKFWIMVDRYSQEGADYRARLAKEFTLPKVDEEWADSRWWVELKDSIKVGLTFLAGGLALLWTLTWVIGWVVRGFLGIPMGQDRRVEKGAKAIFP